MRYHICLAPLGFSYRPVNTEVLTRVNYYQYLFSRVILVRVFVIALVYSRSHNTLCTTDLNYDIILN